MTPTDEDTVAALQGDNARQRRAPDALAAIRRDWLQGSAAMVMEDLALYGAGESLEGLAHLHRALTSARFGHGLIRALIRPFCGALRGEPLGQIPFRHHYQDGLGLLQLANAGRAGLSLLLYEQGGFAQPLSASFTGGECHELVLAGGASGLLLHVRHAQSERVSIHRERCDWQAGSVISYRGADRAKIVEEVHGRMVLLRLTRSPQVPVDAHEYRLSDGALLHRASGSRQESRQDVALAVLHAMGRVDAAPVMADMAQEQGQRLRWQALRHCLSLDTQAGFCALAKVAMTPDDPLAGPANQLKGELLTLYPQLLGLERDLCPA